MAGMHASGMGGTLQTIPFEVVDAAAHGPDELASAVIEAVEALKARHALLNAACVDHCTLI